MKFFLVFSLLASVLVSLLACSGILPKSLNVDESSSGKEVVLPLNGSLKITLEANIVSGYSWNEESTIDNELVIKQSNYEYKAAVPAISRIGTQKQAIDKGV